MLVMVALVYRSWKYESPNKYSFSTNYVIEVAQKVWYNYIVKIEW